MDTDPEDVSMVTTTPEKQRSSADTSPDEVTKMFSNWQEAARASAKAVLPTARESNIAVQSTSKQENEGSLQEEKSNEQST